MGKSGSNLYKRKDGRWEARVIKGYTEQGKAAYAYFYGRSQKEVQDKIAAFPSCEKGKAEAAPRFEAILDAWLKSKESAVRKSSYVKYFNLVNNYIKPSLGHYMPDDIGEEVLNAYIAEKRRTGKRGAVGGLSEKALRGISTLINAVLRFAGGGSVRHEAAIDLSFGHEKPKEMRVLSEEEQASLEKYLCSELDVSRLGILLCLYTGLQVGEICALRWSDISLEEGTVTVSRTMQRLQTKDEGSSAKTEVMISELKRRTVPLPELLGERFKAFRPEVDGAYFLTGEAERYIEPRTYHNHFKAYVRRSKIKAANFSSLRHTFATRYIEQGFEAKSLSEILGHADVSATLERYVHPSFDVKRDNINILTNMR